MTLQRLISGGQTGADRAALDAALALNLPCGGWCPEGRLAEDGPIPETYPLEVLPNGGYRQRTIKNVESSDGTAIFYLGRPTGGTELTLVQCIRLNKPYQLIDTGEIGVERAAQVLRVFVEESAIAVLNVAGPRESSSAGIYEYVRRAIESIIQMTRCGAQP